LSSKDNAGDVDLTTDDESDMICDGKKQKGSVLVADGDNHSPNALRIAPYYTNSRRE
jgi:hypothetical protein